MRTDVEPDFAGLEREMGRQLASGLRPTLQIAVDWRGRRVFERALGPGASVDSTYVLWSATKPLVAVALLQLVEEGALALDTRVAQHFPEFGAHGKDRVTLAELLSHRGGFPDNTPELSRALGRVLRDWDEALRFVCDMPLAWPPGTDRGYHPNSAWFVAGEPMAARTRTLVATGPSAAFAGATGTAGGEATLLPVVGPMSLRLVASGTRTSLALRSGRGGGSSASPARSLAISASAV